jgi:hypothetical protein
MAQLHRSIIAKDDQQYSFQIGLAQTPHPEPSHCDFLWTIDPVLASGVRQHVRTEQRHPDGRRVPGVHLTCFEDGGLAIEAKDPPESGAIHTVLPDRSGWQD